MIKICYVIGHFWGGGAERQLYELVRGINKEQFYPIVISLSSGGCWSDECRKLGVEVIEIQRKKNREFTRLFKLVKVLRHIKPDIVHTYSYAANRYGVIAAIFADIQIIISSERNSVDVGCYKSRKQMYIDKIMSIFVKAIICNSQAAAQSLINKYSYDRRKVHAVHNGINISEFTEKSKAFFNKGLGEKVIGTVGRLAPQKNHKLFLDVAKLIIEKHGNKNIKFMIIGRGILEIDRQIERELPIYSEKLGIEKNVIFAGERKDIPELLKRMDIFIMTSFYEGLSNAIMEAMLVGLPVVATDVGGNGELIINGETGFLCPSDKAVTLADKVMELLNNEERAFEMGKKGRRKILDDFGFEKMVTETERIYMKLLSKKSLSVIFQKPFHIFISKRRKASHL